jgi:1-acyl-sn-glycerol-3-phosphate acyltransferase
VTDDESGVPVPDELDRYSSPVQGGARFVAQHLVMKPFIWSMVNVHVHGLRNLESLSSPFVAIANHSSHLDTPLIMGALPGRLSKNLSAGAAADYWFDHWYKRIGPRLFFNAFPVERNGARNRKGVSGTLLNEGVPLLIYPEGTRSRTGAMKNFKPGSAALSISRNVPVLPIALVGTFAAMPYGATLPENGRQDVHVVFGRPTKATPGEIAHQFAARLHRYVVEMHDTTARAYGMPTQADFQRAVALRHAAADDARRQTKADDGAAAAVDTPPETPK